MSWLDFIRILAHVVCAVGGLCFLVGVVTVDDSYGDDFRWSLRMFVGGLALLAVGFPSATSRRPLRLRHPRPRP